MDMVKAMARFHRAEHRTRALLSVAVAGAAVALLSAAPAQAQSLGSPMTSPMGSSPSAPFTQSTPIALPSTAQGAPAKTFAPGIRVSQTFSDNAFLRPSGQESGGIITELTPYLNAGVNSPRTQASISYSAREIYRHAEGHSSTVFRPELRAAGNALLVGDWLGVQGNAATYFTSSVAGFGGISSDPSLAAANNTRIDTMSLSPYLMGRMGSFAQYRAQYSLIHTSVSGSASTLLARNDERLSLTLHSGPQFNRWGWSFTTDGQQREFTTGATFHRASTVASVYYLASSDLRLGASANYAYMQGLTDRAGRTNGWGPGFSVDWSPSRRTSLRLNVAEQYYGNTSALSVSHRTDRWTIGLNYSSGVFSSNSASLLLFNPASVMSGGAFSADLNTVYQQLLAQGLISSNTSLLATGLLNDALMRSRMLSISTGLTLPRASATATLFRSVRETVLDSTLFPGTPSELVSSAFGHFVSRGVSIGLRATIDPRNSINFTGTLSDTSSQTSNNSTRLNLMRVSYDSRITERTTASLGIRRTAQPAVSGGTIGFRENAVFGLLDVRF